ncbi:MAG: STAS domain-containing protein [Bryobacteraceae bacterium]|nr:STAS domain-containing protein [Bryobacteraceae bacterium]
MEIRQIAPDITAVELRDRVVSGRESQSVEGKIDELLRTTKKIIIDISKVYYLDSAGIGLLIGCAGKANKAGAHLRIVGPEPRVKRLFELTAVDRVLKIDETIDAAKAKFAEAQ